MIRTFAATLAAGLLLAAPALGQQPDRQPSAKQAAQQERMKSCNAQASKKGLKGDERKNFMSECLSAAGGGSGKLTAQQERMRTCNVQASRKDLKGRERQAFMSQCLKD